ncbi:hypothetical protein [Roseomonas xinghualingensis]|uniref:hypothetical protein n=1 Tax=Roseomonas xinghualingensis TaxID=2986475 RepID=UPI0021F1CD62|nr:hypothetical protein [Roseomonas sp. SXEYE001]MCV4209775.1 hypothetical protein [Roseomonas sp. SXEYE001]
MSGETVMERPRLEERLHACGLRLPPEDLAPLDELITILDQAAEVVRAPLPVSAEPANVLVLPHTRPTD